MKKRIFVVGMITILLLSFYTIVFSDEGVEKDYNDFPETDYSRGERFIYGSILKMDYDNREIIIEQHMDDNSVEIEPILKVRKDVIITLQRNDKTMNIDFLDLKVGDMFGLVLDRHGMVRGIIISV